jgi:acyl carrier protein
LTPDQAVGLLKEHLKQSVAAILRMDPMKLDERKSLFDVGMDSLMAIELASTLEESLEIKLPMMALSEGPTIQKLAERIAGMILCDSQERPDQSSGDGLQDGFRVLVAQHGVEEVLHEDLADISTSLSLSSA